MSSTVAQTAKQPALTLTYNTQPYFRSYLKQPPRNQHGTWFFKVQGETEPRSFWGTLTECKRLLKQALRDERKGGYLVVDILS